MAIFHLSVKTISRSAGRSATAAAAYRAGVEITDERTGDVHDYRRKGGIESAELVLPAEAPEWASDRNAVWNAAEQAETRKNSTVAREFEIALPSELSATERQRLARDFAREIVDRHGCVADVCIHAPDRGGDNRNHHAHILLTTRRLKPSGFTEKTRELDDRKTKEVDRWRERFASLQNERLHEAGQSVQVDHRSLLAQGIEREPTKHLGPAATGIERRTGEPSRRRLDFEAEVAQRLLLAKEAGELERQDKAVEGLILDLSGNIEKAKRQRDQEQAQADRQAQAERQEQAERFEQRRLERMSLTELQAELDRVRPLPMLELVNRDAKVIAAENQLRALEAQVEHAKTSEAEARRDTAAWRQAHPLLAKMHDFKMPVSGFLAARQQEASNARNEFLVAAPQVGKAEVTLDYVRSIARDRVFMETAPARAKADELQEMVRERIRQEVEKARQQKREKEQKAELAKGLVLAAKLQREGKLVAGHPGVERVLKFIGELPGSDFARQAHLRKELEDPKKNQGFLAMLHAVRPQLEALQARDRSVERSIDRDIDRGMSR